MPEAALWSSARQVPSSLAAKWGDTTKTFLNNKNNFSLASALTIFEFCVVLEDKKDKKDNSHGEK
jgi:hypothetical protein